MRNWFLVGISLGFLSVRAEQTFESGASRPQLIELFTSEGCSSCPPAERWLSAHIDDPDLWKTFAPLSWHVTYWDYLGWTDAFARKEYSKRQYDYAAFWNNRNVYTPCFVRDGAEWQDRSERFAATAARGRLSVTVSDGLRVKATYSDTPETKTSVEIWVALTASGITTDVKRGENAGRALQHDFVVAQVLSSSGALQDGSFSSEISLTLPKTISGKRLALVVWVTASGQMTPLQVTGGWLKP